MGKIYAAKEIFFPVDVKKKIAESVGIDRSPWITEAHLSNLSVTNSSIHSSKKMSNWHEKSDNDILYKLMFKHGSTLANCNNWQEMEKWHRIINIFITYLIFDYNKQNSVTILWPKNDSKWQLL